MINHPVLDYFYEFYSFDLSRSDMSSLATTDVCTGLNLQIVLVQHFLFLLVFTLSFALLYGGDMGLGLLNR